MNGEEGGLDDRGGMHSRRKGGGCREIELVFMVVCSWWRVLEVLECVCECENIPFGLHSSAYEMSRAQEHLHCHLPIAHVEHVGSDH